MAGLCEGGNEPSGSLKAILERANSDCRQIENTSESAPNLSYAHCTATPTMLQSLPVKQYYCACSNGTVCRKCQAVNTRRLNRAFSEHFLLFLFFNVRVEQDAGEVRVSPDDVIDRDV
ncbi:hypothetical protein ANN_08810 [Periplaneta americana]|uniref:Uncharacterized protein n=1 Tax=Periplaneta americana TaxID=6978 RepID=A0ABQ8T352_PERAM|nr:hypothetical protein ANN_08810 [Periplaneta americana]